MQMLEAQQAVVRRIMQELMTARVSPLPWFAHVDTDGGIDFNAYLKDYIQELANAEAAEAKKETPLLVAPDTDAPIIFGG